MDCESLLSALISYPRTLSAGAPHQLVIGNAEMHCEKEHQNARREPFTRRSGVLVSGLRHAVHETMAHKRPRTPWHRIRRVSLQQARERKHGGEPAKDNNHDKAERECVTKRAE